MLLRTMPQTQLSMAWRGAVMQGSGTNDGSEAIGESKFGMVNLVNLMNLIPS